MIPVRLSSDARDFLRREARYLNRHSTTAARDFLRQIAKAQTNLSRFPEMGPGTTAPPVPGVRRYIAGNYVLDYQIETDAISILAIRHGRMDTPNEDALDNDRAG